MSVNLRGRHFLKEIDFTPVEWSYLIDLTAQLKVERKAGKFQQRLAGKNLALLFEKTSTRTRCAFEVAAYDEGAHVTTLDAGTSQMGHKESIADTVRVLSGMFDGIEYRGAAQGTVETMAKYSDVPVWNGLTDQWHPTQSLCDIFTMAEASKKALPEISYAYLGDSRFNMGCSLLIGGALAGADVRIISPTALQPGADVVTHANQIATQTGAKITITEDLDQVEGCDFIHTDIWVSMGEPEAVWAQRIELLRNYQVNAALLQRTGNPAVKFMHCLPSFHNRETQIGEKIFQLFGMGELEVTDEVFESANSIVFDQAENRMHSIKAVIVATLT
ncbi:MAG: ornithine carbamoyltransferase [Propionibacteriaceae bacterium]|nr:ornithine carbamoyltransferase [Propionibacteriaceae bacterium]